MKLYHEIPNERGKDGPKTVEMQWHASFHCIQRKVERWLLSLYSHYFHRSLNTSITTFDKNRTSFSLSTNTVFVHGKIQSKISSIQTDYERWSQVNLLIYKTDRIIEDSIDWRLSIIEKMTGDLIELMMLFLNDEYIRCKRDSDSGSFDLERQFFWLTHR